MLPPLRPEQTVERKQAAGLARQRAELAKVRIELLRGVKDISEEVFSSLTRRNSLAGAEYYLNRLREEAQRTSPEPILSPTTPLGPVNFNNASVREILQFIGQATGINVLFDRDFVDRQTSINVEGVTLEGQPFDWSAYSGKVVLLDFWATWCGPCIEELPNIRRNFEQFHAQGFDVVGINLDTEVNDVKQFLTLQELPWATVTSQVVLEEAPGTQIPDNTPAGISRSLSTNTPGNVGSVEVRIDINHTWIGDLRVSLRSPAGTEVVLYDQAGGSADNLAQTYTAATTPGLALLTGQPLSGPWQLNVSDRAAQDVGKLDKWRLVINPQG